MLPRFSVNNVSCGLLLALGQAGEGKASLCWAGGISDESPELECFSRQDPYDSACCIYQRQDSRQCQKAESHRLAYQVMMQFAREVIFANGAERRLATICPSATDIVEHRCLIIIVRLRRHTASVRSGSDQTISMINLEFVSG